MIQYADERGDPELYDKFNGCFKAVQLGDQRTTNFWVSQLEKSFWDIKQYEANIDKTIHDIKNQVFKLLQFCNTSRSKALDKKKQNYSTTHPLKKVN